MKASSFHLPIVVALSFAAFVCADEPKPDAPKVEAAPLQPVEETKSGKIEAKREGAPEGTVAIFTGDVKRNKKGGEISPKKAAKLGLKQEILNLSAKGDIAAKLAELAGKGAHVDVTGMINNGTMEVTKVSESQVTAADTTKKRKKKEKATN